MAANRKENNDNIGGLARPGELNEAAGDISNPEKCNIIKLPGMRSQHVPAERAVAGKAPAGEEEAGETEAGDAAGEAEAGDAAGEEEAGEEEAGEEEAGEEEAGEEEAGEAANNCDEGMIAPEEVEI